VNSNGRESALGYKERIDGRFEYKTIIKIIEQFFK
jgi:hypothetical protein